jgi:methylenetetrahydrofolate dehydrogenase (NADP+)/methenyltetrahydrofolate cyclohydrolase
MTAQLLAGAPVAEAVLTEVAERVAKLKAADVGVGLGTILVGDDPASAGYIAKKHEACERVGMLSLHQELPSSATQSEVVAAIERFNDDATVDAMLVQHPLPKGLDYNEALLHMDAEKDADGLHPMNLGKLAMGAPAPVPCTPAGIQAILQHYGVETEGRHVVVMGRGTTLGRPVSLLLSQKAKGANAAVTVVHTGVPNWGDYTRQADIVIAAVAVPSIIMPEHVRPGAVVVSGGITWEGKKLLADVDESVGEVASWITPRLGGVGPTTVAMLLRNTVAAAERRHAFT